MDTHCTDTANRTDMADRFPPLVKSTDISVDTDRQSANVCMPVDLDTGMDTAIIVNPAVMSSQSADATDDTEAVATDSATKPLPWPQQCRRHPVRYLDNVQVSSSLIGRVRLAPICFVSGVQGCLACMRDSESVVVVDEDGVADCEGSFVVEKVVLSVDKVFNMPQRRFNV